MIITHSDSEEGDGLVDAAQRRHIDSLATNGTLRTDTCGIFSGAGVHDGIDKNLELKYIIRIKLGVTILIDAYLDRVLVGEEVDDLEGMSDNADSKELLAVVAALHHETECIQLKVQLTRTKKTHLSTNRSTMGICAFLNCFLA